MTNSDTYCGLVTLVGRPNVGKSTLLNKMMGKKLSITSHKPQTTRQNLYGVKTQGDKQACFIDTPGIHLKDKRKLNQWMNKQAKSTFSDVDIILFMVEAGEWTDEDENIIRFFQPDSKVILIVNKIDSVPQKETLLPYLKEVGTKFSFTDIIPISAFEGDYTDKVVQIIFKSLPPNPFYFPADVECSHSNAYHITEIIREKIMRELDKEVPYSSMVQIEKLEDLETLVTIHALIWVERDGQKAIMIGEKGATLKSIGTHARRDLERLLGKKVMLKLWVKVKSGWADCESMMSAFGFQA